MTQFGMYSTTTPPPGGNQGPPGSTVANWAPDLDTVERRVTLAMLIKL